jgi:hypothetical protein
MTGRGGNEETRDSIDIFTGTDCENIDDEGWMARN